MKNKVLATLVMTVVAGVASWGLTAFAMGSIPANDGTIQGCFQTHKNNNETQGQLRVVSDPAKCKNNETPLSLSQPSAVGGGAILHTGSINLPVSGSSTVFSIVGGNCLPGSQTEKRCQLAAPRDGTLANLFIVPSTTPATGSSVVSIVRINGADTPLSVTHTNADGASAKGNTIDSVNVNQGDLISVKFTETGGVTTPFYRGSFEFK